MKGSIVNAAEPISLGVLMACHNRREKTLRCLDALSRQDEARVKVRVYLVDDGSSDGTAEAVTSAHPAVRVIRGDGSLFWCGGMRLAWTVAARDKCGAYLWLNDDTNLLPGGLTTIVDAWEREALRQACSPETCEVVVVGSSRDPVTGRLSFGELGRSGLLQPPSDEAREIPPGHSFNGNVVLVSAGAHGRVGNLSEAYSHSFGDVDYGIRAHRAGVRVVVVPGFVAECGSNPPPKWQRPDVPLSVRWKAMHSPKGYPPREAAAFFRLIHGWMWPLWVARVYWRLLRPPQPAGRVSR